MRFSLKRYMQGSLRRQWIGYFCIMLLFPLAVNYGAYLYISNSVKAEIDEKNHVFYENIVREANFDVQKYKQVGAELGNDDLIQEFSNIQNVAPVQPDTENELRDMLNRYYIDLYKAYRVFVYFDESNMVLTLEGLKPTNEYLEEYFVGTEMFVGEWKEWLADIGNTTMVFQGAENVRGVRPRYTVLRYTIYENRNARPTNLVIVLDEGKMLRSVKDFFEDENIYIDILNEKGYVLASNVETVFNRDNIFLQVNGKNGSFQIREFGKKYHVYHTLSEATAWRYIFYVPEKEYYATNRFLSLVFIGSMLLVLFAGIFLIRIFVDRQYSPIEEILRQIPSKDSVDSNELRKIEKEIINSKKIQNENSRIKQRIKKSRNDRIIRMVLNGQNKTIIAQDMPMEAQNSYTAVVLFSLQGYQKLFCDDKTISDADRYDDLIFILENIGEEIFQNARMSSYFLENDETLICMVNYQDETLYEWLLDLLNDILQKVEYYFSLQLTAGVGRGYKWENISKSYQEALCCMGYISQFHNDTLIFYDGVEMEFGIFNSYNIEEENVLNLCIQAGEREKACAQLNRILNKEILYHGRYQFYVNEVLSSLLRNFGQYIEKGSALVNNIYLLLMLQFAEPEQIQESFQSLVCDICDKIQSEQALSKANDATNELTNQIKAYIEQHYSEPELSNAQIAEHYNISISYLSRIFRQSTGGGILDYINHIRIEAAKELLQKDVSMRNEDAAQKVGIVNINTFTRLFKKYTGVTPGVYKKSQVKH